MAISFYDHGRQGYADVIPPAEHGEFTVRDYDGECGVGSLGEFKITLHRFSERDGLAPKLQVFGDALGALRFFMAVGGADAMASHVASADEFSRRLIALGLTDRSDEQLEAAA